MKNIKNIIIVVIIAAILKNTKSTFQTKSTQQEDSLRLVMKYLKLYGVTVHVTIANLLPQSALRRFVVLLCDELTVRHVLSCTIPQKTMNKLYKFKNTAITSDQYNTQGKLTKYLEVYVISSEEDNARIKGKLSEDYSLMQIKELGKDWN